MVRDNPLSGIELTSTSRAALTRALARLNGRPLNTVEILQVAVAADMDGDWEWVQVHSRPLQDDDVNRYTDDGELLQWNGTHITRQAFDGLTVAARIARAYDLIPMPPAVLVLGALWEPEAGATRSLLDGCDLTHAELLTLVQDATLGMRLEAVADVVAVEDERAAEPDDIMSLEPLLRDVARHVGADRDGATYITITTASVLLALVASNRGVWEKAAAAAHLSLDAYEANLRWVSSHPTEVISGSETELDRRLVGIRLTEQLATAVENAHRAAVEIAGTERPDVLRLLPVAILSVPAADALRGIREQELTALRAALVAVLLGGTVPALDDYLATRASAPPPATEEEKPVVLSPQAESAGFRVGAFIGAAIVAVVGGMPVGLAFGLAWFVQFFGARTRRKPRSGKVLGSVSAVVVLAAVVLAVTAAPDFTDDVEAVTKLEEGRTAIDRKDPIAAMPLVARANLLQNESVSARLLSACISWELNFRDDALNDLQLALNLGYEPGEASHYRGRSCFVDSSLTSGVDYLKSDGPATWLVYPRPHSDEPGQRLLDIADRERTGEWTETYLALACLADRYDLRTLAAFYLTVGINAMAASENGASSYVEIRTCLKGDMVERYKFYRVAEADADVFFPADYASRVPSPTKPHPAEDACWARFPAGRPCNADE